MTLRLELAARITVRFVWPVTVRAATRFDEAESDTERETIRFAVADRFETAAAVAALFRTTWAMAERSEDAAICADRSTERVPATDSDEVPERDAER